MNRRGFLGRLLGGAAAMLGLRAAKAAEPVRIAPVGKDMGPWMVPVRGPAETGLQIGDVVRVRSFGPDRTDYYTVASVIPLRFVEPCSQRGTVLVTVGRRFKPGTPIPEPDGINRSFFADLGPRTEKRDG